MDVRLKAAMESGHLPRHLLISGPAGTGKTFAILCLLHLLAADYPNLRILICRQTRVSLTESVLVTFEEEVLPADGMESIAFGNRRKNRQAYHYPTASTIVLGGLDNPDRILSTSWDIIFVNESIEIGEDRWDALASRLQRPGRPTWLGYLIGDTNPGDPAHWLKKRIDEGRLDAWDTGHRANPALHDGRGWTEVGRAYLTESLGRLRGTRRKRLLDGLWAAGEGAWFETFDTTRHVSEAAEFDPRYPVHLPVDTGVHCGGVWFQLKGDDRDPLLTIFGDHYSYNVPAFENGKAILESGTALTRQRQHRRDPYGRPLPHFDVGRMDPSGNANNGTGLVIGSEFLRAGLKLEPWPKYPGCVASGLALVESFVAVEPVRMLIHPRCRHLIDAFANYKRKKRGGQWIDEPEDPQHPHEELIDSLRSGLLDKYPEGRKPAAKQMMVHARRVF